MDEILPPDIRKEEEKGIDEYLSEGFNLILSNPKLLIPFIVPLLVNIIYGIYLLEHFFVGWPLVSIKLSETSILNWKQFLIVSIFVVIIIMVFMLWGVEVIAYFVVKERNISKALFFGAKKLPVTFVNYIILLVIVFVFFTPIVVVHSLWFILVYSFLIAVLVSPLVFLLPPIIVEKNFAVIETFVLYKKIFKKSLILGLLYSLVSSAVSSLIPIIGGILNTAIVIPGFVAVYSLLYRDYKEKESGFLPSL
ncbi:hypothetical protein [Thermococcus paralvinellae]|uniref:Uncharacterized protein n=1 Tax=Thermococcus paralvinellae TaxID=582419 RepID=W0I4L2_9EURY|nr:hypothetical protein [Thermococcus paralvinellae]AHF79682.1 Hypothetical protein TES1_0287 [Thermococcus paralvinellae]